MQLRALAAGFFAMIATAFASPPATPDTVLLLHGLGRTQLSMLPLARALEHAGYRVINASYPSRTQSLEQLAATWLPAKIAQASSSESSTSPTPQLHIVTHSMGGILLRLWLRGHSAPSNLGRVVMLAPPNAGSELADELSQFRAFRWFTGPNGPRLGTHPHALPRSLGPWPVEHSALGIIAGSTAFNPLADRWLPAPHDGKVSVAATHLAGARDHCTLPISHTWLPCRDLTHRQVLAFLRTGNFPPVTTAVFHPTGAKRYAAR